MGWHWGLTVNQDSINMELGWQPTSSCLHPFSTEVTGVFERAWLFTWILGLAHRSTDTQRK